MLLMSDPVTKVKRRMHFRPSEETYVVSHEQDDKQMLEENKSCYNTYRRATDAFGEWGDHVARIPSVVWGHLLRLEIANNTERLQKWLDDSDNRVFRRRPGKLGKIKRFFAS